MPRCFPFVGVGMQRARWHCLVSVMAGKFHRPCNGWNRKTSSPRFSRISLPASKTSSATAKVPDHPLVKQTVEDCLTEAMDIDGLENLLRKIENREVDCIARDLPEPSPLAHEILNARPYAFLDNAPLEERRTQAVYTRRASDQANGDGLGVLDVGRH